MRRWGIRARAALLFGILLLDGGLLGAAAGVAIRPGQGGSVQASGRENRMESGDASRTAEQLSYKPVALTFDDGPDPEWTPMLLDGLAERGVVVTFFLMGQHIEGNEDLVARMQKEGHLIGNHSYSHIQLTKAGEEAVLEAVEQTQALVEEITGKRPQYLRPPYGDWNESLEEQSDLHTVLWTVDSLDWKLRNTSKIVRHVIADTEPGDIILMHDIFKTSVEAALSIIDELQNEGYTFVTVDELRID